MKTNPCHSNLNPESDCHLFSSANRIKGTTNPRWVAGMSRGLIDQVTHYSRVGAEAVYDLPCVSTHAHEGLLRDAHALVFWHNVGFVVKRAARTR